MADENTMRRLWRYKSDLEQELDEEKLIEILEKLKRLPVTISALQETGIGRVVNGYRKREGVVGDLARKVVGLWKAVVETEVKTSRHRSPSQSPRNVAHDAEADEPEHAEVEDPERAEVEDPENNSDNESDANSWNSYKESDRSNQSSPRRKRKHSVDSVSSHEGNRKSSESSKKGKHTPSKSGRFQVDSAGDHTSDQKKKHTKECGDVAGRGSHSRHAAKSTGHAASSKQDTRSSASLSARDHNRKDNTGKSKTGSSSSHHNVNEKGDRQKTIDRRQRRHSLSPSEDDDDGGDDDDDDDDDGKASGSSLHSSKNGRPSSSNFHKHSSSSSSHKDSPSSHKHSANSHKPSHSSDMQSPSLKAGSHSSTSSSHKHSSSSSSHKHSSTSSSHKHPNSDKPSLSSSHKHSSSSDSHKNSSDSHRHSSNSQKHSSDSHKHSSSSHRHTSSSASHKHSSPSEAANSSRPSASPSEQQKGTPEDVSSKPQSSKSTSNTSHGQNSGSSNSQSPADSSRSRDHSADHHKNSEHTSRHINRSGNMSTSSKEKDSTKHHSSHSSSKKPTVSDNETCAKELRDSSEKSGHSAHRSHKDEGCSDKHSSSKKHSEKENHDKKSNSSSNKQNNSNLSSDTSDCKPPSGIYSENEKLLHGSISGNKSEESKPSSSKFTKVKPATSTHKKTRHKPAYEQPDLDLFSEAIHFKAEPSSPVRRPSSSKQTDSKSPKPLPSSSSKPSAALSSEDAPSDPKVKAESSISEPKNASGGSSSLKDDVRNDIEEDSDSQQEYDKYTSRKDKKRKKAESPVQDENMSFEDFMAFDEVSMVKKGKSSAKSSTKASSSTSSTKDSHSKVNKAPGGKPLATADLPTSSKTGFSVPVPAGNVTVTELDILKLLPETHANYKPLRFNNYYRDEDEREESPPPLVDPDVIGTKTVTRTHVYSGRKHGITEVKSLYDLCMHVLIDNIDAIDCVGGIPYSILKPVLERCTAQQLYQLEDYNPHFLEDTDELWDVLCQRDFRGCKPDELETWRELYMRKFEERELKYQKLKQTMSTSISKGQAGRKAQLAYVDTVAKPPREVLRKQRQFGTGSVVVTKNKPNIKGSGSGLRTYKPSTLVPAQDPMDDRPRMVKAMPPMLARSIQMRKNMRR